MSNSQLTSIDDSKARAESISTLTEFLAKIVGVSVISLGLLSLGQVAFSSKNFSLKAKDDREYCSILP